MGGRARRTSSVVLHDTEPCGRSVALPFADACRQFGVDLVEPPVAIVPMQSEYEALAGTITASGADLVFYGGHDAGATAEGILITFGSVPPELLEGPGRVFSERYVARFGEEPECYAASAYDTAGVILQAIERVGRADRATITETAFATRKFDGVLGRWSFDANGDIDLRRGTAHRSRRCLPGADSPTDRLVERVPAITIPR